MNFPYYLKEIGRGAEGSRDLALDDAHQLYGAMLDGGVPDLELGAILIAMRLKGEVLDEMLGFMAAVNERTHTLRLPQARYRPVVLPSYNGARKGANLTPLLALLLQRFGVPVLVHGLLEGFGRVTSGHVFRELGVLPAATLSQAQRAMDDKGLAFVPVSIIAPGLANLLALRARMGVRSSAHSLVKMVDPFAGQGVLMAAATHPAFLDLMREMLLYQGGRALLFRATEGEPFANPKRRPRLEYLHEGSASMLFDAEHDSLRCLPSLPEEADAVTTAHWIQRILGEHLPLPQPIANQLACCLYASGYAESINQAKAIIALEGNGMALAH